MAEAPVWPHEVLAVWFRELGREAWFAPSDAVDVVVRSRLSGLPDRLLSGELGDLVHAPVVALAAVIGLDQVPRHLHRGTAQAFRYDGAARDLARSALAQGFDRDFDAERRLFLYLPFEHSESAEDQALSVALFAQLGDAEYLRYAEAHKAIIDRFGRFPHRNAALGRPSTPAELAFLALPESSF
jgi:uncharacterized protein (DUF924 family)